ncbi:MAG: NAD-dependent epimerase/dehydratase family protein [Iphinoe sp. HA4291-MV1]|jgi:nucleoside-diphosphate-sugar epimerase|nr:NAD-dependent epimerase/dehydratase family protein [Iphinoe sp. HA4291-MV1]
MKHLVTGGSGYLGNLIARRLYERGESVKVLDIWEDPTRPKGIEFVNCDICDRASVTAAMKGIDIVHHNAALNPLTKAGKKFWQVNVEGSRIVAEEAVKADVKSFIHTSSSALFGGVKTSPITQDTPPKPIEIYGKAKLAGELVVDEICEKANLPLITLRPRAILGEGRLGIFQILFEWIEEGRNVYVIGDGNNLFQFIHPLDLMDAYMLALDLGKSGTYNVGTDGYNTLRQALEHLIAYAGSESKVIGLPVGPSIGTLRFLDLLGLSPLAPFHYLTYHKEIYFDVDPLLKLGWKPKYSNNQMLCESYDWFKANKQKLANVENANSVHRRPVKEKLLWLLRQIS